MLKLYNTLTQKEEEFRPIKPGHATYYTCGPTVYAFAHIGNIRTKISEDLLHRLLLHNGYKVKRVMNITDVGHLVGDGNLGEDKMKVGAKREGLTAMQVANRYTEIFLDDMKQINWIKPDVICRATEHIPLMLEMVKKLDDEGYIYRVKTGMYFDTSKSKDYGKLSGMTFEKLNTFLIAGARVERAAGIRNTTDFAVWRFNETNEKEMIWQSEWGEGFPGWHIECSAMSMHYLGESFDIHTGGVDLRPIHHTNEIAQSEAVTGKKFVNYWLHTEFLNVNGTKMSKSLGNVYSLRDVMDKGHTAMGLRFFFLSGHYRKLMNFTFEAVGDADQKLSAIYNFLSRVHEVGQKGLEGKDKKFIDYVAGECEAFFDEMNDDMNTPEALPHMHAIIKETNRKLEEGSLSKEDAEAVVSAMLDIDSVMGLDFKGHMLERHMPEEVKELIEKRELARKDRDFAESDRIRKMLLEMYGVVIEDTKDGGVRWHFK